MMRRVDPAHVRVAIVGAGFAGIGMAIRLRQSGVDDFVILERAAEIGGVWRDNVYPNCACDVPAHLYSLSFVPEPDWHHSYARQPEILDYLRRCVAEHGLGSHLRLEHALHEAAWDAGARRWRLDTSRGIVTADALVLGAGALSDPAMPNLPGLDGFAGRAFHSARWDQTYDVAGKRVAVIGTGASAIQIVPAIQARVERLYVFQRTPPWIIGRGDRALGELERRAMRIGPLRRLRRAALYGALEASALMFFSLRGSRAMRWAAERHLRRQVRDPGLRERLHPTYAAGCKRILVSDDYLPALGQPNVELVTDAITRVHADAIETQDGHRHPVDCIVLCTGFRVQSMPVLTHLRGRDGRSLAEHWRDAMTAHLGTTVVGFPNFFMLQGPHTGLGHTSVLLMIESQIEHVLAALRYLDESGVAAVEPTAEAQAAFVRGVDDKLRGTVWTDGGCKSWYLDEHGHSSVMWPGFTFTFKRRVEGFDPHEYRSVE
jgi:cation diffusion facilitator CzcD-associated flavoprotein CzcO